MAWWNPIDWAKHAVDSSAGIADNVKNWVVAHVRDAVNAVERDIDDIEGLLDSAWNSAVSILSGLISDAEQAAARAYNDARGWFNDAEHYADSAVTGALHELEKAGGSIEHIAGQVVKAAVNDLGDIVDHAWSDVTGLARDAEHYADEVWAGAYRDVVKPLAESVAGIPGTVERYADDAVSAFERDVLDPAVKAFDSVRHDVAAAADWIAHEGGEAVHLVEQAASWLELLGLHTVSEVEALPGEVLHELSPANVLQYYRDNADHLTSQARDLYAEIFGG